MTHKVIEICKKKDYFARYIFANTGKVNNQFFTLDSTLFFFCRNNAIYFLTFLTSFQILIHNNLPA